MPARSQTAGGKVSPKAFQRKAILKALEPLPPDAPIRAAVAGPEIQRRLGEFEEADAKAIAHQNWYRRLYLCALLATTLGTVVGALALLPFENLFKEEHLKTISLTQTTAMILTTLLLVVISVSKPVDKWLRFRADAERKRSDLFEAILQARVPGAGPEFTRQQLDVLAKAYFKEQIDYFVSSARRHERAASHAVWPKLFAYALLAVAFTVAAMVLVATFGDLERLFNAMMSTFSKGDDWHRTAARLQLGLGTMASALLAHANARSLMDHDERKAALYKETARNLTEYLIRVMPEARTRADAGDGSMSDVVFQQVRHILEGEHAAWIGVRSLRNPFIGKAGGVVNAGQ